MSAERQKCYVLPNLMPAPTSDIQASVRCLIEYADLSIVRPILEQLQELNRPQVHHQFLKLIAKWAARMSNPDRSDPFVDWDVIAPELLLMFWWDLFDLTETLAFLEKKIVKSSSVDGDEPETGESTVERNNRITANDVAPFADRGGWGSHPDHAAAVRDMGFSKPHDGSEKPK